MTWDEQMLVTASDDGCIFVYDVKDKDAKAAARWGSLSCSSCAASYSGCLQA